jgi:phage tail-like protein
MSTSTSQRPVHLIEYLPSIYHDDPLLEGFLRAFEKLLAGIEDGGPASLEETIAGIATLFDPRSTPQDFLAWLAGWTAFTLRADLTPDVQREFIANIIQRYRRRGTLENLRQLLSIFVAGDHKVMETTAGEFQVGKHSTVGVDTWIGGGPAHFFEVTISLPRLDLKTIERQKKIARSLIDLEKPAHTFYTLQIDHPTIQIGFFSTVGVDTLIGS